MVYSQSSLQPTWWQRLGVNSGEKVLLTLAILSQVMAFALAWALDREVDWPPFLSSYVGALGFVLLGIYIRARKGKPRLALVLQGIGSSGAFASGFSIVIFTLLPLQHPMVDPFFTETGHWVGYDWHAFAVAMMTEHSGISRFLGHVYHSSQWQILLTIFLLARLGRATELYRFLFVGMITLVIAVAIWWRWPSVGYVGTLPFSSDVLAANGFTYKPNHGALLTRLLQEGPGIITVDSIWGVVGFPSYHMIMALMVTWYCRRTVVFLPMVALNTAMIPATLLHGGHHVIDILGGLAVFAVSVWIANRLIKPDTPDQVTSQSSSSRA